MLKSKTPNQSGATLIELVVALTVGSFIIAAVIQVYLGSVEASRFQTAQARVQETGRFVIQKLAEDIRGVGYQGCNRNAVNPTRSENIVEGQTKADYFDRPLRGYTADSSKLPDALDDAQPSPSPDTEILVARTTVAGDQVNITGNPSGKNIQVSDAGPISKGDVVMATNCQSTTIFQVTSQGANGGSLTYGSGGSVSPGNEKKADINLADGSVYRSRTFAYYIGNDDGAALYRAEISPDAKTAKTEKMASGVARLAFEYGVDNTYDATIDKYKSVDQVTSWDNVLAVKASIIAASNQKNIIETDSAQQIEFPPGSTETVEYSDKRLREAFTTVVQLRNRI